MKPEPQSVTVELTGGKTISFETGKLAKQAHGSVVVRFADNVVLGGGEPCVVHQPGREPEPVGRMRRIELPGMQVERGGFSVHRIDSIEEPTR